MYDYFLSSLTAWPLLSLEQERAMGWREWKSLLHDRLSPVHWQEVVKVLEYFDLLNLAMLATLEASEPAPSCPPPWWVGGCWSFEQWRLLESSCAQWGWLPLWAQEWLKSQQPPDVRWREVSALFFASHRDFRELSAGSRVLLHIEQMRRDAMQIILATPSGERGSSAANLTRALALRDLGACVGATLEWELAYFEERRSEAQDFLEGLLLQLLQWGWIERWQHRRIAREAQSGAGVEADLARLHRKISQR